MEHWSRKAVFYHIYPLGLCGAPERNDFSSLPEPRLNQLYGWLDHLQELGVNALYLGPLFESSRHGYDTADYYSVDRRLGDKQTLTRLVAELHRRGMHVILDGVFNHVGRDFWAFRDVLQNGQNSAFCDWFEDINFSQRSPYNDPFSYAAWSGNYDLVKLNLSNPAVRAHLLQAVAMWLTDFLIDGLRLDVADCLDLGFQQELAAHCKALRLDFWLLGEVIHGDYRRWVNPQTLDSVTNYECYKGLYSSHVDHNLFEIAYSLQRQFGAEGIYRDLPLYAFADNHDVDRVASKLSSPAQLYSLYCLLFCMPGVPSIYYGSEWGLTGLRSPSSDTALRPALNLQEAVMNAPQPELPAAIARLAQVRRTSLALQYGSYQQLQVSSEQMAFARQCPEQTVVVLINIGDQSARVEVPLPDPSGSQLVDLLNLGEVFEIQAGQSALNIDIPAHWGRILQIQ